jgi:DNA excision repair protein ERCC-8
MVTINKFVSAHFSTTPNFAFFFFFGVILPREFRAFRKNCHEKPISSVMWYTLDTGCFVSGSFDGTVKVWDTNQLEPVETISAYGPVYSVSMSRCTSSQNLVAVGSKGENVILVDLRTGRGIHLLQGHTGPVFSTAWSPGNPNHIVTGSGDRTLRLWDIRRSGWIHSYNMSRRDPDPTMKRLILDPTQVPYAETASAKLDAPAAKRRKIDALEKAHDSAVVGVAFTPDSKGILSTGADKAMRLWETDTGINQMISYPGTKYRVPLMNKILLSTNGKLVYHPNGESVGVYEVKTGKKVHTLKGHYAPVTSMAYHTSLPEMYTGAADGSILVWTPFLDEVETLLERGGGASEDEEEEPDFWDSEDD